MDTLLRDLRYVARSFRRSPGFFVVTALTLALGIGATTAIFSVVNGVLLQPLPYPNSDRIVQIFQTNKNGERNSVTEPNFADWKAGTRSFSSLAMHSGSNTVTVNGLSEPARARATPVSGDFFTVFGVKPELGRPSSTTSFVPAAPSSVIVSHAFWQKYLGGSPNAPGKTIKIGTDLLTIVGVMPEVDELPRGQRALAPARTRSATQ